MLGFAFVPAAWMSYLVREREMKCKYQQLVSGVSLTAYWLSSFAWDAAFLVVPIGLTLSIYAMADIEAFIEKDVIGATVTLFCLYAISMPPFTYMLSFAFTKHDRAQSSTLFMNWAFGMLGPIIVTIMSFFESVKNWATALKYILSCVPQFALGNGLFRIVFRPIFAFIDGRSEPYSVWDNQVAGLSMIFMAATGPVYLITTLALERLLSGTSLVGAVQDQLLKRKIAKLTPAQLGDEEEIDEDVAAEKQRVSSGGAASDVMRIEGLRKIFANSTGGCKMAVKETYLGIPKGQVFGLLGINGAGKTTTLSILSSELPPTQGAAYLADLNVNKNPEQVHRLVGYCPQFDALFPSMTAREHLRLYGAIKGVPKARLEAEVNTKIKEMGLTQYADRLSGGYSGGNKRKLSVAVAMIGDPHIVFLDEPSTGMDPQARRFMWDVICRIVTVTKDCAMILTTHSMEECEALCQRIGIMVEGRLRCLGSVQHLKSRFGKGFQFEATVALPAPPQVDEMLTKLSTAMPGQTSMTQEEVAEVLKKSDLAAIVDQVAAAGSSLLRSLNASGKVQLAELASWAVMEQNCLKVKEFTASAFAASTLREKQGAKMRFELPKQDIMLGEMFGLVEDNRQALCLRDYSLSQVSLETVFNSFANQSTLEGEAKGLST
ncbi:unnamed protein product [Chrysoparadoxa australica]